ncbi:MAG: CBS domain-containing protein [Desulfovibrio sp.]|nr:CBS domain-containing protein [Desulfovibrio sp.]
MLAARHLYQPCFLLFPGTQERGLHKVFSSLDPADYNFRESASLNWMDFQRLVLVDTRQRSRIKHVAPLLQISGLCLEVWDHHPDSPDDLKADVQYLANTGAVTSRLVQELRRQYFKISAQEATLLGLGIYGDTGSFTYSSTTSEDFQAAAWLLEQGMDVNQISEMAAHELTSMHIQALNSLLESAHSYTINGMSVVLAEASMEHYLGDFAYLAHRLMEMEKFTVLFAIGIMGDRIQVVARSRCDFLNVGDICVRLGGGGHVYAASASIRSMPINEVRETILRGLFEQAHPEKSAREYMSSPAVGVEATARIREADELMLHFGLKAVPVFGSGTRQCVGILDAQTASRARAHGLAEMHVENYMQRRFLSLSPDAEIKELTNIIIGSRQRLVPIVENEAVIGVVTRTDLINIFAEGPGNILDRSDVRGKERNVGKLITDRLPQSIRQLLLLIGDLGRKLSLPVYIVGGFVRDLLLDRPNHDIDLVVEGNGIALAKELARVLGGRVREHQKFLTSVVIFTNAEGQESRIDVATARLEYYEYPAALPTVELSSIKMDLFRRDFSINALAVRLDSTPFGQLLDFFGGQRDIKERLIRVLHTLSFVEDPTRCLRAVRFEQRYKFKISPNAEKLIRNVLSLRLMERLSSPRLFNEYQHICNEADPPACFIRLEELGILQAIMPQLTLTSARRDILKRTKEILAWYRLLYFDEPIQTWFLYFLSLNNNLNYIETSNHFDQLGLPENKKNYIMAQRELMRGVLPRLNVWQHQEGTQGQRISALWKLLRPVSLECLLFMMAVTQNQGLLKNLSRYIMQWRHEKPDISGADLQGLGLTPGPLFGRLLQHVLEAKLDGQTPNAESQINFIRLLLANDLAED